MKWNKEVHNDVSKQTENFLNNCKKVLKNYPMSIRNFTKLPTPSVNLFLKQPLFPIYFNLLRFLVIFGMKI